MYIIRVEGIKMAQTQKSGSKKSKRPISKPSKKRYWVSRRLEHNKVKKMMKAYGMTEKQATDAWNKCRKHRVPDGFCTRRGA